MLDLFGAMIHWFLFGCSFGWWQFRNHVNDRGVIFVRQGPFIDHVLAVRRDVTKEGQIFQYDNGKHAVIVKLDDPLRFWEHERMLGVVDGETIASAFDKADRANRVERQYKDVALVHIPLIDVTLTHKVEVKPEEVSPDPVPVRAEVVEGTGRQQDETLISNVIDGHLATELAESPTAPGKGGWGFKELRWVLLIGLGLIIVFVVYKFVLHGHLPFLQSSAAGNSTVTPTPMPTITPHFSGLIIQIRSVIGV